MIGSLFWGVDKQAPMDFEPPVSAWLHKKLAGQIQYHLHPMFHEHMRRRSKRSRMLRSRIEWKEKYHVIVNSELRGDEVEVEREGKSNLT